MAMVSLIIHRPKGKVREINRETMDRSEYEFYLRQS